MENIKGLFCLFINVLIRILFDCQWEEKEIIKRCGKLIKKKIRRKYNKSFITLFCILFGIANLFLGLWIDSGLDLNKKKSLKQYFRKN